MTIPTTETQMRREILEIPAFDGKVLDGALVERCGHDGTRRLDERRLRGNRHDLFHGRYLDRQITQTLEGADRHDEPLALHRLEPAELSGECVRTDR